MQFKKLLRQHREAKGWTNARLAAELAAVGHSKTEEAVARWQRETDSARKAAPDPEVVIALEQVLGISDRSLQFARGQLPVDMDELVRRVATLERQVAELRGDRTMDSTAALDAELEALGGTETVEDHTDATSDGQV